ncbi:MAG: threonine dehydratase [Gammaproteobacteria bacterium]|nr:threonine dehydratase [Gammaproteobacteria bacterium]
MFTLAELERARELVGRLMPSTPQYAWPLLHKRVGAEVWLKHENHTPIGAFKLRGGLVYLDALCSRELPVNGLITATRGNHGQSIPYAASHYGLSVTVLVPDGNSVEKNNAMMAWGAKLIVHGDDFDEASIEAGRLAERDGLEFVPAFHPALVCGVATYAYEFLSACDDLDTVYVPIGMGSGICGLITTRDLLGLKTEIVGVVSTHAAAYALSFEHGRVVETETANTFADGMACRVPSPDALEVICRGAARIVSVSDDEVAEAMRAIYADTHNIAEGAGAAAFAALLKERERLPGCKVGAVLTGGNIDTRLFARVLQGETPRVS